MGKTKYRIGTLIFRLIMSIVGLVALLLTIWIFVTILDDSFDPLIIGVIVYYILSCLFLYLSIGQIKSYEISEDYIKMSFLFGLINRKYKFNSEYRYNLIPFVNKMNTYKGIAIQVNNGDILHITQFDFRNYSEIEYLIKNKLSLDKRITLKEDWSWIYKTLIGAGIIIMIWVISSLVMLLI